MFFVNPMSTLPMPSARSVLRGDVADALAGAGRRSGCRTAAGTGSRRRRRAVSSTVMPRQVAVGVEVRPDRVADQPVDAGQRAGRIGRRSATVNGAPLWSVKNELTCQPPSILPTTPCWSRINGSSHTKLPVKRCGRSYDDAALVAVEVERILRPRPPRRSTG